MFHVVKFVSDKVTQVSLTAAFDRWKSNALHTLPEKKSAQRFPPTRKALGRTGRFFFFLRFTSFLPRSARPPSPAPPGPEPPRHSPLGAHSGRPWPPGRSTLASVGLLGCWAVGLAGLSRLFDCWALLVLLGLGFMVWVVWRWPFWLWLSVKNTGSHVGGQNIFPQQDMAVGPK